MASGALNALTFIINSIAQLYLLVLLLRLFMPWMGATFHNPVAQAIFKLTSPLVVPVRRILPPVGKLDTATLTVAFGIQYLVILLISVLRRYAPGIVPIAVTSLVNLVVLAINLFVFAIIIRVVLSWVSPGSYNPATAMIHSLTEPVMRPFRRLLPPIGGIDLSPVFAIILLSAAGIFVSGFRMLPV
ncbi:MAG: YggT family protein [Woeseiaceae bacterium]|jgi:YggT family protein|nr:YggT family protein [Woeseiaceae bacterium]